METSILVQYLKLARKRHDVAMGFVPYDPREPLPVTLALTRRVQRLRMLAQA